MILSKKIQQQAQSWIKSSQKCSFAHLFLLFHQQKASISRNLQLQSLIRTFQNRTQTIFSNNNRFTAAFLLQKRTIWSRFKKTSSKSKCWAATGAALFTWDEHRFSNEDVKSQVNEMMNTFRHDKSPNESGRTYNIDFEEASRTENEEWTKVYDRKSLIIWRRRIVFEQETDENDDADAADNEAFEYKVLGRVEDLTALEYFEVQLDLSYRREWDHLVVLIEQIDKDDAEGGTELVKWIMKFPYPLYPREYLFVRRYCVEPNERMLVLVSKSIPANKLESTTTNNQDKSLQYVRVNRYKSNMIIMPDTEFDKPGLIYIIQYYDVNKAKIPKIAYKWMAASGLPDYVEKLHKATLKFKEKKAASNTPKSDHLKDYSLIYMTETPEKEREKEVIQQIQQKQQPEETKETKEITENSDSKPKTSQTVVVISSTDDLVEPVPSEVEAAKPISSESKAHRFKRCIFFHLKALVNQLNEEYFNQSEPHPIFDQFLH